MKLHISNLNIEEYTRTNDKQWNSRKRVLDLKHFHGGWTLLQEAAVKGWSETFVSR